MRVYGIKTCDTVAKARRWLDAAGLAHQFHDFRRDGLSPALLDAWIDSVGWEALVNRKGTTWRQLGPAARDAVCDAASAKRLMLEQPSVIKRPVIEWPGRTITVGYDEQRYAELSAT